MILLPIHPEYVDKIRTGGKKFEFRTRVPTGLEKDPWVLVYATQPVGAIVGYFRVTRMLSLPPTVLWERTKRAAGITRKRFREYFKGRTTAFALEIGEWKEFVKPCSVTDLRGGTAVPQSFTFLSPEQRRRIMRRGTKQLDDG